MKYFGYLFFRFFVLLFSFLPFRIIYLLADFAFFLLYKVFKYRRELVRQNLNNSFPDKSKQEIDEIELNFYHNLADISIESIKGMSLSEKQLKHRYKVINPEVLQKIYDRGVSVIGVGSHYANWEWGVLSFSLQFPH
ncbi:MAG: lipid A biosynthesis acyltransferase, partial [Bacteroidales bacterium]|nr:lipid A biosynthesis acyltransferase [Bacteroidales bacterium]